MVGVQVLEAVARKVAAQLSVRRPADPERMPGAEDVVLEAGLRDLCGLDRATEPVVPLEHAHTPPCLGEQRRTCETVDAAADDDGVVDAALSHPRASGTPRP